LKKTRFAVHVSVGQDTLVFTAERDLPFFTFFRKVKNKNNPENPVDPV
jgi:hypothetical protein